MTIRLPAELVAAGLAPPEKLADLARVAARYAVALTPEIAALIDRTDPHDPIARQFVPDVAELATTPEERADPIGDDAHAPVAGIVHRYPDRVLLKLVNVCAVYCRFCFRREMVGPGRQMLSPDQLDAALAYVAGHPEIWEVILTGGDPLVLSARRLGDVVRAHRRDRPREDHPPAHPPAGRSRRTGSRRRWSAPSRRRARRRTSRCTPIIRAN